MTRLELQGALSPRSQRRLLISVLALLLPTGAPLLSSVATEAAQEQEQSTTPQEPESPPRPRVVGRAGTQEELEAWQTVNQATDLDEKASLATRFLESYPESGLTPFAHQLIAQDAYQKNNIEKFIAHAEVSLEEIPQNPDLLTPLAFVYAEQGESEKAIQKAEQSLEALERIEKPLNIPAHPWVSQIFRMRADSYYSLGRAYLGQLSDSESAQERAQDPNLQQAIQYLTEALTYEPAHDYSQFRLGFAYTNANQAEPAIIAYARATVIGGAAAGPARKQLEAIHSFVQEHAPDSRYAGMTVEEILQQQEAALNEETETRDQKLAELVARIEQEEARKRQELQRQQGGDQEARPEQFRPSLASPEAP